MRGRVTAGEQAAYNQGYENGLSEGRVEGYDRGWIASETDCEGRGNRYQEFLELENDRLEGEVLRLQELLAQYETAEAA